MTHKKTFIFVLIAALSVLFLAGFNSLVGWTIGGDSEWYIRAAEGRWSELIQPYSGRFLHPFLVGFLSNSFSLDLYVVFFISTAVFLLLFFIAVAYILKDTLKTPLLLVPLFFLPFFFNTVREVFQPDAFYIFLTAIFFLLLFYGHEATALITLFLLFLTRESTALVGATLSAVAWFRQKRMLATAALVVTVISFLVVGSIASAGQSNVHGLGGVSYVAAKFLYNSVAHVLGLQLWVNTYAACEPVMRFTLPNLGVFGNIREAGICGFDPDLPLRTLVALLTTFGVLPVVLWRLLRHRWGWLLQDAPFWLYVAVVYGIAHYFISIPAGTGIVRIVGYAWPAFLLALPYLAHSFPMPALQEKFGRLVALHFLVAWLPLLARVSFGSTVLGSFVVVLFSLGFYLYIYKTLRPTQELQ